MSARRVHVDTDPGLDDLLALALAFASPELDVVGVTTVAGNASLAAVTENWVRAGLTTWRFRSGKWKHMKV